MTRKYIIYRRQNKILYFDALIVVTITALLLHGYLATNLLAATIIGLVTALLFIYLFFYNKLIRYSLSILFSLSWSAIVLFVLQLLRPDNGSTATILAIIAFFVSLWAHKNHFFFLKHADLYEYEKY